MADLDAPQPPPVAMTDHDAKMAAQAALAKLDHPAAGDVYRHYKGGLYAVVMVGIKEDTLEPMVGYYSYTYRTHSFRTLANWNEGVETPDGTVPRFRLDDGARA
jgi:hypothetical protein